MTLCTANAARLRDPTSEPVENFETQLMKQPFYTDREHGQKPRITETINKAVWGGIYALVSQRLADNSLGQRFPETCPDVRPDAPVDACGGDSANRVADIA